MKGISLFLTFLLIWNNLLGFGDSVLACINDEGVALTWENQHHDECEINGQVFDVSNGIASNNHQESEHSHQCMECEDVEVENVKSSTLQNFFKHLKNQDAVVALYVEPVRCFKRASLMSMFAPRGPPLGSNLSVLITSTVVLRV